MIQADKPRLFLIVFFVSFSLFAMGTKVFEQKDFCYLVTFAKGKYIVKKYTLSNGAVTLSDKVALKLPTDHNLIETYSDIAGKRKIDRFNVLGFFNDFVLIRDNYKSKSLLYNIRTNAFEYVKNFAEGFGIKNAVQLDNKLLLIGAGIKSNPKLRRDDFFLFALTDIDMGNTVYIGGVDIKFVFVPVNGKSNFPLAFYCGDKKRVGLYFPATSELWIYSIKNGDLKQKVKVDSSCLTSTVNRILCINGKLTAVAIDNKGDGEVYSLINNKWEKKGEKCSNIRKAFLLKNHLVFLDKAGSFKVVGNF
jgi:hypothetical protein